MGNTTTAEAEAFIENDDEVFKKFHHEVTKFGERKLRSSFCSKCGRFALSVEYLLEEKQLGVYIYDFKVMKLYEYGRFPEKHFDSASWTYWYGDCVVVVGTTMKHAFPYGVTAQYLIELDHEKRVGKAVYTREYTIFHTLSVLTKQHSNYSAEVQSNGKSYSFISSGAAMSYYFLFPRCPWDTSAKMGMTQNFKNAVQEGNAIYFTNKESVVVDGRIYNQWTKEENDEETCVADSFVETNLSIILKNIELGNKDTDLIIEPAQEIQMKILAEEDRQMTGIHRFFIYEHEQILITLDKSETAVVGCFVFNAKDWTLDKIRIPLKSSDMISRHSSGILLKWSYDEADRLTVEKLTNQRRQLRSLQDICRQKLIGNREQMNVLETHGHIVFRK